MDTAAPELIRITVDLTVFGDAPVIETRLPRSAFGRIHLDQHVLVVDDAVDPRPYRVDALMNGGRDVRLVAV